jgi:glutamate-1-semialdehyde 2,1-aminomutase
MSRQDFASQRTNQLLRSVIPGGVNSPFRSFQAVGGEPPVMVHGSGAYVGDIDGNRYLDLCGGWGPLILGHSSPLISTAVQEALESGVLFGSPTPWELEFAQLVREIMPSMQRLRFVNSGAEAVASALRVARGVTRRPRILKFEGCYHGHVEALDSAGLEAESLGGALAVGASPGAANETLVAIFNDIESVRSLFAQHPDQIAGVIIEPITGSMGVIEVNATFLEQLAALCADHGSLLIFDEVLSGFRVALGGAQARLNFSPDLTCLGKALAGGLPIGAYGGKQQYMDQVAPLGPIYQAGTFCGNPVSMRAGTACLQELSRPGVFQALEALGRKFYASLQSLSADLQVRGSGGLFSLHFGPPIHDHRDLTRIDLPRFARFYHSMLDLGVYLPPSCLDAACISLAHRPADLDASLDLFAQALEFSKADQSGAMH